MPTDTHVVIRFSDAMEPSTLTSDSLTLRGPSSVVITHIVAAEHGRLAFIWPAQRLAEGTTYALTVAGARNAVGLAVIPASIAFTTAERRPMTASPADQEQWSPDAFEAVLKP